MEFRHGRAALTAEVGQYPTGAALAVVARWCLSVEAARPSLAAEAEGARRNRWAARRSHPENAGLPRTAMLTRHHMR
jgi:hypothetical protein